MKIDIKFQNIILK